MNNKDNNKENQGTVYKIQGKENCYGLAREKDQRPAFSDYNKLFLRLYLDIDCEIPYKDEDGKHYVSLRHIKELERVAFID